MDFSWCTWGGDEVDLHARVAAAFSAWEEAAPCTSLTYTDLGVCDGVGDARLSVVWADPEDVLEDGVVAALFTVERASTLVLDDGVPFGSDAEVAAGTCDDALNLDHALRRWIGAALGLDPVCEGEPCTTEEAASLMSGSLATCDARVPTALDGARLTETWAPVLLPSDVAAPAEVAGGLPRALCVSLPALVEDATDLVTVTWAFGDGTTGTGLEACHTYTEEGVYVVRADLAYAEECGVGVDAVEAHTVVTACAPPHADGGLFSWAPGEALRVGVRNHVDRGVPACVTAVSWVATDAADTVVASAATWEPAFTFPRPGRYDLTLTVSGPGGSTVETQVVSVAAARGCAVGAGGLS
ncbi:MAG: PKD domain-containing protein, partial [Myxococcota bacterium]